MFKLIEVIRYAPTREEAKQRTRQQFHAGIREAMHDAGVNQTILADYLGTTKSDVSQKLDDGNNLQIGTIERILDVLGVDIEPDIFPVPHTVYVFQRQDPV